MSFKGAPPKPSHLLMGRLPSLPPKQFGPRPTATSSVDDPRSTTAPEASISVLAPSPAVPSPSRKRNNPAGVSVSTAGRKKPPPVAAHPRTKDTTSLRFDTRRLRDDRLGTLVSQLTSAFDNASSWEAFATEFRGRSYLSMLCRTGLSSLDGRSTRRASPGAFSFQKFVGR